MNSTAFDIINDKINSGQRLVWTRPWNTLNPQNLITKREYSGVNFLTLALLGNGCAFLTAKQAFSLGLCPEKGKSLPIGFWKPMVFSKGEGEDAVEKRGLLFRVYHVWSVNDCTGDKSKIKLPSAKQCDFKPIDSFEAVKMEMIQRHGLTLIDGNRACFYPSHNKVEMPRPERFVSPVAYYKTLTHELAHWCAERTGTLLKDKHASRSKDKEGYAFEELVAELTAAHILNLSGIDPTDAFDNSAAYIQDWQEYLTGNPKALVMAASRAYKRASFLLGRDVTPAPKNGEQSTDGEGE